MLPVGFGTDATASPRWKRKATRVPTPSRRPLVQCEKDQAIHIKRGLEAASATGGLWHVICGREFGASVAHENNMLIVARLGRCHALAFQSYDESSLVRVAAPPRRAAQPAAAKAEDDDDAEEKAGTDAGTLAAGAS